MSFQRNRKAEAELPFLEVLGDFIEAMEKVFPSPPTGAATVQKKALDEPAPPTAETAGSGQLFPGNGSVH